MPCVGEECKKEMRMSDMISYSGKRVVIVGAYSGMGRATAERLVAMGASVDAFDVRAPDLPGLASFTAIDLRDAASIDAALATVTGTVDCLFYCAGLPPTRPAADVMAVNFLAFRTVVDLIAPNIPAKGAIVSIASYAGVGYLQKIKTIFPLIMTPDFAAGKAWCEQNAETVGNGYAFSKECLIVYTMRKAAELGARGVRINCTAPGTTATPMYADFETAAGADFMAAFPRPLGREGTVEDQAGPLLFLNSAAAGIVTGQTLFTDGGIFAGLMSGTLDPTKLRPAAA
jgi:NAD(P)-dependent dehydrogenase (short-subunit alcohol dehydrogenase family)